MATAERANPSAESFPSKFCRGSPRARNRGTQFPARFSPSEKAMMDILGTQANRKFLETLLHEITGKGLEREAHRESASFLQSPRRFQKAERGLDRTNSKMIRLFRKLSRCLTLQIKS